MTDEQADFLLDRLVNEAINQSKICLEGFEPYIYHGCNGYKRIEFRLVNKNFNKTITIYLDLHVFTNGSMIGNRGFIIDYKKDYIDTFGMPVLPCFDAEIFSGSLNFQYLVEGNPVILLNNDYVKLVKQFFVDISTVLFSDETMNYLNLYWKETN